jgi:N-acetylmuramic acid 6-phosphate etherase
LNKTESPSSFNHLEKMSVRELLTHINEEDKTVPFAIEKAIPQIIHFVDKVVERMSSGGRMFYIGAGTSGRLGILDASEIPPTYGLAQGRVVGLIAGGDQAIRKAVEHAEDDPHQAWKDLGQFDINQKDILLGIAASGRTPYVIGGIRIARENGITTGCITCNEGTELARHAEFPIEIIVGPEFVTGSTRMKSGTAQKLVLNMISTSSMIRLGHVVGNKMIDMQPTNNKLIDRGARFIMEELGVGMDEALSLLKKFGSVRKAIENKTRG